MCCSGSPKEGLPEEVVTFNADDILNDPEIDTVVEVMGGLHPAYEYVSAALARGKNVVTANKALIAAYYTELTALAREKGAAPALHRRRGRRHTLADEFGAREAAGYGVRRGRYYERHHQLYHGRHAQGSGGLPRYSEGGPGPGLRRGGPLRRHLRRRHPPQAVHLRQHRLRRGAGGDSHPHLWHPDGDGGGYCGLPGPRFCLQAAGPGREHGQRRVRLCGATLVGAGDLEAAVPANFNLITYEAEQLGRQSFYGQGAGRFPTAENVVQDCLTVLSGKRGFYTDRAVPCS